MNLKILILAVIGSVLLAGVGVAEYYKWVDEKGDGGERSDRPESESQTSKERAPYQTPEVELYTTSWCGYCGKARDYFRSRGIPFREYDIERDQSAARRKSKLDPRRGVPFAVVNGQPIHGYSPTAYARALELTR